MGSYRILSIDGGGVKGVLSAKLLERLKQEFPNIIEESDLITGNSAGSYVALGLSVGYSPEEMVTFFEEHSPIIFGQPNWMTWIRPKYGNKELEKVVGDLLGEKTLRDVKKKVVIPTFLLGDKEAGHWRPVFFHNFEDSPYLDTLLKDVVLASSAAPTYFPSHQNMIDGGVFANNPSTLGVGFALSQQGAKKDLEELTVLSIGTGFFPYQIQQSTKKWGDFQWIGIPPFYTKSGIHNPSQPLIDVLMEGVTGVDEALTSMMIKERYFRLNPILPNKVQLDDYSQIPDLVQIANETRLSEVNHFIETQYLG